MIIGSRFTTVDLATGLLPLMEKSDMSLVRRAKVSSSLFFCEAGETVDGLLSRTTVGAAEGSGSVETASVGCDDAKVVDDAEGVSAAALIVLVVVVVGVGVAVAAGLDVGVGVGVIGDGESLVKLSISRNTTGSLSEADANLPT